MIYVLIIVCSAAALVCDLDHALWAEQSAPLFDNDDECFASAELHLKLNWDDIAALKDLGAHKTVLICTEATEPA